METKEEMKNICTKCKNVFSGDPIYPDLSNNQDMYCEPCTHEIFKLCGECLKYDFIYSFYSTNEGSRICSSCRDNNYFACDGCGDIFHRDIRCGDDDHESYCESCFDDHQNEEDENGEYVQSFEREYNMSEKHVAPTKRAYSCEIECYTKSRSDLNNISHNISSDIGISKDGSLGDHGVEFQTPKLSGKKGSDLLKKLCDELNEYDVSVDKSCGLHIHINGSDFMDKASIIKKMFIFYLVFEPVIFSYLPISRRKNRYCMPLSAFYHYNEIESCRNKESIEKIWYREQDRERIESRKKSKYDDTRYAGINFHSLLANGHLEIRYHSGTINYAKIKNWMMLHTAIVNEIVKENIDMSTLSDIRFLVNLSEKEEKFFELIKLPKYLQKYFRNRANQFGRVTEKNEKVCAE